MPGFAQSASVWIGPGPVFEGSTNWQGGRLPSPANSDVAEFDGLQSGNLILYNYGYPFGGPGGGGLNLYLTGNQTGSVSVVNPPGVVTSGGFTIYNITNDPGAGSLILGGTNSSQVLYMPQRPSGVIHNYVNNSTNPVIINPWILYKAGGGSAYTLDFSGSGIWIVNNNLQPDNGSGGVTIQVDGPGTVIWNPPGSAGYSGADPINGVNLTGGTLILGGPHARLTNRNFAINGVLLFNATNQPQTLTGVISGNGAIHVAGGALTLKGLNTFAGATVVDNGLLFVNGTNTAAPATVNGGTLGGTGVLSAPVSVSLGGTLSPGPASGVIGALTINNNLALAGTLAVKVNKTLSPSNDVLAVTGLLTNAGAATVTVTNLGPALAVGDRFVLFNQPVQNGASITVTGAGMTWLNQLAVDGSVSVAGLAPPVLGYVPTGGNLQFSWTGGFKLQAQTNTLGAGLGANWMDYPGGAASPVTVPLVTNNTMVLFRLISTP